MTTPQPMRAMPDPAGIYQGYLDATSPAVLAGDADFVAQRIQRPFVLRTGGGEAVCETLDELRGDIMAFAATLKAQGVTHYIRLVSKAHYVNEDLIEGWHTSYLLRNATMIVDPYRSRMLLRRCDGDTWRVTEAEHELANERMPMHSPKPAPGCHAERWTEPLARIRATNARAEPIYQVFLDSLDRATARGDYEDWCRHYTTPHHLHLEDADLTIERPEDLRRIFDKQRESISAPGVTMQRRVKFAEFIGDTRIVGYHDATWDGPADWTENLTVGSRMVLVHDAGRWRATDITNTLSATILGDGGIDPMGNLPTLREIQKRMTQ